LISLYPASSRFSAEQDWLKSNFSFSFGPYHDKENTSFGPMRVLNDDYVAAGRGFGAHPHSDMEVVSIVLSGKMRHQDNLGNDATTSFGEVQRMSAGTGIIHTEFNASETDELNLLQMWFMPSERGLPPSYETTTFDVDAVRGQWVPVAGQQTAAHVAKIHQDMTIYLSRLDDGQEISFSTQPSRRVFLFVIEGEVRVNEQDTLADRDSARITGESELTIKAVNHTLLMLIDLP
jgi:quercetin 2,3-dioxygenase